MSDMPAEVAAMAEEIREIQHKTRSALTVLSVGAHYLEKSGSEDAGHSDSMVIKINQINTVCDRLEAIAKELKTQVTEHGAPHE